MRDPSGIVTSSRWNFGHGYSGTGPTSSHTYRGAGSYLVALIIGDTNGRTANVTRVVGVEAGTPPTAIISALPAAPTKGDRIFFNAHGSTAAPGRVIVSYTWDFGDGASSSGGTIFHRYQATGRFVVTLSVTDDTGQVGIGTADVTGLSVVGPKAVLVFSPTNPGRGQTVFFDGVSSEAGLGRDIVRYRWNFGDGTTTTQGSNVSHVYASARVYAVQLTVTNDRDESHSSHQAIEVSRGATG